MLIHPISITRNGKLVAGRRRIGAFKKLGLEEIPFTITDIAIKEDGAISKHHIKIAQKRRESVNAIYECLKELAKLQRDSLELLWEEYLQMSSNCYIVMLTVFFFELRSENKKNE